MRRFILFLALCMVLVTFVNAQDVYKVNEEADIRVICDNNGFCGTNAQCNVTIVYPNNSLLVSNAIMTNNNAYHNYTVGAGQNDVTGTYEVFGQCTDAGISQVFDFDYEVTGIGYKLETSDSILYFIYILAFLFVFLISLFGAVTIPFRNKMNPAGELTGINYMKYLKIACAVNIYIMLLFFAGTMKSVFEFFLMYDNLSAYFSWMYSIMFATIYPFAIMTVLTIFLLLLEDKKVRNELKQLERMLTG